MNASNQSPPCSRGAVFAGLSLGLLLGLAGTLMLLQIGGEAVNVSVRPPERVLIWVWAAMAGLPVLGLLVGIGNLVRNRIGD